VYKQIVNNYQQLSVSNVLSVMSVLVTKGLENLGRKLFLPKTVYLTIAASDNEAVFCDRRSSREITARFVLPDLLTGF
jgi:hypothetical protein